jgi:hypothetical protein
MVIVIAGELKCSVLAELMVVVHEAKPSIAATERRIKIFFAIILHFCNSQRLVVLQAVLGVNETATTH